MSGPRLSYVMSQVASYMKSVVTLGQNQFLCRMSLGTRARGVLGLCREQILSLRKSVRSGVQGAAPL